MVAGRMGIPSQGMEDQNGAVLVFTVTPGFVGDGNPGEDLPPEFERLLFAAKRDVLRFHKGGILRTGA